MILVLCRPRVWTPRHVSNTRHSPGLHAAAPVALLMEGGAVSSDSAARGPPAPWHSQHSDSWRGLTCSLVLRAMASSDSRPPRPALARGLTHASHLSLGGNNYYTPVLYVQKLGLVEVNNLSKNSGRGFFPPFSPIFFCFQLRCYYYF